MRALLAKHRFALILLGAVTLATLVFHLNYHFDNKYMAAAQNARNGVVRLDMASFEEKPCRYLINGWEFYRYKALDPEQIKSAAPDAYIFIGQYAGFEMNNESASPHGDATYRITVYTDEIEREFALELPEIYSSYRIWINGTLKRALGADAPMTDNSAVYFRARDKIEIVIAAHDQTHFYSGLVYPPALGTPDGVNRLVQLRLLLRVAACCAALLLTVLLTIFLVYLRDAKTAALLIMLLVCFVGYIAYPIIHAFGAAGLIWYDLENMFYYAMIFTIVLLHARLIKLPRRVSLPAKLISAASVAVLPLYRRLGDFSAQSLFNVSSMLAAYIWAVCLYLLATTLVAVIRKAVHGQALLTGFCVFALSLVYDRVFPMFEPIVGGWHNELAGFVLLAIILRVYAAEALSMYRERLLLREENERGRLVIAKQTQKLEAQRRYVDETAKHLHEYRSGALVAMHKIRLMELEQALALLEKYSAYKSRYAVTAYSDNEVLDALLSCFAELSRGMGFQARYSLEGDLKELGLENDVLASLMANLLENALEANARLDEAKRAIHLSMRRYADLLLIECVNPTAQTQLPLRTAKRDKSRRHGYGLRVVRDIAKLHGGEVHIRQDGQQFHIRIDMRVPRAHTTHSE